MNYQCPVCGYDQLVRPPENYSICPSCWTEFGNDDIDYTIDELRARWIRDGYPWHSRVLPRPRNWNPVLQLERVLNPVAIRSTVSRSEINYPADFVIVPAIVFSFQPKSGRLVDATTGSAATKKLSYAAV